ncbi:MAG: flagellar basal body P-ring formation chaperone FlgA [Leptothrix sp. (in: b-proteobacteria)]
MKPCRPHFLAALAALLAMLMGIPSAHAQTAEPLADALAGVRELALGQTRGADTSQLTPRVEVITGQLDPRLKLAPCLKIEPYLPTGQRLWGTARVGLRCTSGTVHWNVYLPVTVRVWAPAVVAARDLPAGTELQATDLRLAEVDLAAAVSPACTDLAELIGRRLAVALAPGATLRADAVRARQWFAAGDPVTVIAQGDGFAVSGSAQALAPGLAGQSVRVRTDSGRILVATPVGERRVELRP